MTVIVLEEESEFGQGLALINYVGIPRRLSEGPNIPWSFLSFLHSVGGELPASLLPSVPHDSWCSCPSAFLALHICPLVSTGVGEGRPQMAVALQVSY